ncbi:MAG: hypothetical protein ACK4ME_04000 [Fimbriimonadales bacterium]
MTERKPEELIGEEPEHIPNSGCCEEPVYEDDGTDGRGDEFDPTPTPRYGSHVAEFLSQFEDPDDPLDTLYEPEDVEEYLDGLDDDENDDQ